MKFKLGTLFLMLGMSVLSAAPQKVITYNVRYDGSGDKGARDWEVRAPNVINFIQEHKASVVGMQEVLVNQMKDLEKNLPGYAWVGVGRDDGKAKGEFNPVFYDKAVWKLDKEQNGTFWLSDTPEVKGSTSWGNTCVRICTWVRLIDKDGKGIYIYNTHWDHQVKLAREKSAGLMLEMIKKRKNKDEPYVMTGDLNTSTLSDALKTLLGDGILIDPAKKQMVTFNFWHAKVIEGNRIDHIFVSPQLKNAKVEVMANGDPPASDHHPVVLTVDLDAPAKP